MAVCWKYFMFLKRRWPMVLQGSHIVTWCNPFLMLSGMFEAEWVQSKLTNDLSARHWPSPIAPGQCTHVQLVSGVMRWISSRERGERGITRSNTQRQSLTQCSERAINKKPLAMPSCRWLCVSRQLPMSCFFIPELTFTLCLKTRQSICCLCGSKVSSIRLIIYMTFRKSGSDLLSSFCPLCSLSPVPTQTVNGEFITSSPPIIFRMKRIYISFITLYHCYCGETRH